MRRQRMMELQQQAEGAEGQQQDVAQQAELQKAAYEAQKKQILKKILSEEARHRLSNIRVAKPEFAEQVEMQLIQLAQTGRLPVPVSDEQFKLLLDRLYNLKSAQKNKREIKFIRK